jgi:hypothetical protein
MPRYDELTIPSTSDSFSQLTVPDLTAISKLLAKDPPPRKGELVAFLTKRMTDRDQVSALYDRLDEIGKAAVQEAACDPEGILNLDRFQAKYGQQPDFGTGDAWSRKSHPSMLRLFFPQFRALPDDLRELLLAFVPEPQPLKVATTGALPATLKQPTTFYSAERETGEQEVELRTRETARQALHDVKAVLRLIDAGAITVGSTGKPSQKAIRAITEALLDGDFYSLDDCIEEDWDPAGDLTMKAFAWPLLLQAAGLVDVSGSKLHLSAAGRKAATKPAHELIRLIWDKWLKTTRFDEFNRVSGIKGQQSKGALTAVAPRRQAVADVLAEHPRRKWIAIDEIFRVLRAAGVDLIVTRNPWKLYIDSAQYGALGYAGDDRWPILEGRFVLAFLFEYAATLGLLDVAYISPVCARRDYYDRWGTDDLSCLSRYDGLRFVRINDLGAWCLGRTEKYEPQSQPSEPIFQVLANFDVVASKPPLTPADALFLDRFADRQSEAVWRLSQAKILAAEEQGLSVAELKEFLTAKSKDPLPQTVEVMLTDLANRAAQLEDLGPARLIACADETVARLIASDRRLRSVCQIAGDRHVVFRAADEAAVRRGLRELGYVLRPPR